MTWNTILVPHDFSASADHAVQIARHEAKVHGARIVLLHVVEMVPHFGHDLAMMTRPNTTTPISVRQYYTETATAALESVVAALVADGIDATSAIRCGVPIEEIRAYVGEQPIDLIVMGTHGRTGLRHALVGSVAERIVRQSPVPVLTIRHPA
ncbi:MAG: universal stress protein [Deltaproteobacteria bacterium]|nr:universal stress protein [Deltaproteobacteria bacterium]